MECLLLAEANLRAVRENSRTLPENINCSSESPGPKVYALLPAETENHPFRNILGENDIQILSIADADNLQRTELHIFEVFVRFLENRCILYFDRLGLGEAETRFRRSDVDIECDTVYRQNGSVIVEKLIISKYALVENENLRIIENLLKSGTSIIEHAYSGTIIHFAAYGNLLYANLVKLAVECGVNLEARSSADETALHEAAQWGSQQMVSLLVELGAQVDARTEDLSTPLHKAIAIYSMSAWTLVANGADVNAKTDLGSSPLHEATIHGSDPPVIEFLLKNGADVHATDWKGRTPLFYCWEPCVMAVLVEHGADINAQTNDKETVLLRAVVEKKGLNFDYVLSLNPILTVEGNKKAFKEALCGDDDKFPTYQRYPKLPMYEEFVEKMVRYGFDVDETDANQPDMLFGAIAKNSIEIVEKLIGFGADVNQYYAFKQQDVTPLRLAIQCRNYNIVQLLVHLGADIRAHREPDHRTPIADAVQSGSMEIVKFLMSKGVELRNEPNLLHLAAKKSSPEVIQLLLEERCDLSAVDNTNKTPLAVALRSREPEALKIIQVLVRFGARVNFTEITTEMTDLNILNFFLSHCFTHLTAVSTAAILKYIQERVGSNDMLFLEALVQHCVKMHVAGILPIGTLAEKSGIIFLINDNQTEVEALKIKQVGNSALTYFDILMADSAQLTCYAKNSGFRRILESSDVRAEFPVYGDILRNKLRAGSLRCKLLLLGVKVLSFLCPEFSALPCELKEFVIDYLNNQDLFIFRKCLASK